jgi:hypothetical protein
MKLKKTFGIFALTAMALAAGLAFGVDAYETKSNRENRVRVDVKPIQLTPGRPAKFEVRMNTHSADLGQDMVAVSNLKDNLGREYMASGWQGSPPGGHHRKGVLEFPDLAENSESITLVIREIDDVPERTFNWRIEK